MAGEPERLRFASPAHITVYRALDRAARAGDVCPSNETLAALAGYAQRNAATEAVNALERNGLIEVERYQTSRRVKIVHTGRWTAEPWHKKTPHWRHRG